jgi:hypothetical protein
MGGFRVVTAVGEKRVGRIVGSQGDYYIVKRSLPAVATRCRSATPSSIPSGAVLSCACREEFCSTRRGFGEMASSTQQPMGTTAAERSGCLRLPRRASRVRRLRGQGGAGG